MRPQLVEQLIFDGQSFNYAPIADFNTYPFRCWAQFPTGSRSMVVTAIAGTTYSTRSTTVASRVDPLLKNAVRSVIIDAGGPSDVLASLTAAQILTAAESYADARRAALPATATLRIVELTVTPSTSYSGAQDTVRLAYNALLLANANHKLDAIADIASLPHAADPNNTTYYSDGLHPAAALADDMAALVHSTVLALT